jgi:hypothetical protein
MKNIMNLNLSPKAIQRGLWIGAALLGAVTASADTHVTFQVDMSAQISGGTFNPGTDTISASGSFNGWNTTATPLTQVGSSTVYSATVDDTTDANGTAIQYKFVDTQSGYEATQGDGANNNRCALLPSTSGASLTLPYTYFADAGPATAYPITFQVDMAEQANTGAFNPASDTVACQGWFEGWSDANFPLTNDTALNVTNNGNITSMPYVGTYTTWAVSPGEESDFKYVYNNGSDVYEGVAAANQNPDGSGNRYLANAAGTLPLVNFNDQLYSKTVTNNIVFELDMTVQVLNGSFTNGIDTVAIRGDLNGWGEDEMVEQAAPNTNLYTYTNTYIDGAGAEHYFKYYIDQSSDWESLSGSDQTGGNRFLFLAGTNGTFTNGPVYFNDLSINDVTPEACYVTFTVDMTPAVEGENGWSFINGFDDVYINGIDNGIDGSYWTWPAEEGPSQYQMNEIGDGNLYTITVPVNAGQSIDLVYKYGIDGEDDEAGVNDNHNRYIRTIVTTPNNGGYIMPTDLFGGQGSGNATEPSFGNLSISHSGNNVGLTWLGRSTVKLQQTSSLTPPIVWTPLPLTDGTNLIVSTNLNLAPSAALTTNVSTNYPIGTGNTYYELIGPQ